MKKVIRFIVLAVAALTMCLFVGCGEEECTHTYATDWTSDATMHWHAGTCECGVKNDVAGHTDANDDGACDVCAYADANHTHTYAEAWSSDKDNHWHESTCYHTVVADVAAHTADKLGNCTVCGYKVGEVKLSVAEAIVLGASKKAEVFAGTYTDFDENEHYYEFHESFTYVYNDSFGPNHYYYMPIDDENVLGVKKYWHAAVSYGDNSEWRDEKIATATIENTWGPAIDASYLGQEGYYYGLEDLLVNAYEIAKVDNLNGDFAESVDSGVYKFSFGVCAEQGADFYLYVINVAFTLDSEDYYINNLVAHADVYVEGDLVEVAAAANGKPAQYAPVAGAEPVGDGEVIFVQGTTAFATTNSYNLSDVVVTDYTIYDEDAAAVTGTVKVQKGYDTYLYIDGVVPASARLDFADIALSGENVNTEEILGADLDAWYEDGGIKLSADYANVGDTFTLNVSVNGVVKTVAVEVIAPIPTEVTVGYDDSGWFCSQSKISKWEGESVAIAAILDRGTGITATVISGTLTLPTISINENGMDDYHYSGGLTIYSYALENLVAGTYEIKFESTVDNTVFDVLTLVVKAIPTTAEILDGYYMYSSDGKNYIDLDKTGADFGCTDMGMDFPVYALHDFLFENATTSGDVTSGDITVFETYYFYDAEAEEYDQNPYIDTNDMWDPIDPTSVTYSFTYSVTEGFVFKTKDAEPQTVTLPVTFEITEDYGLSASWYMLTKKSVESLVGEWSCVYMPGRPQTVYYLRFNDDGTGLIVYGNMYQGMGWAATPAVNYFTYTVASAAEEGEWAITFSENPAKTNRGEVAGFALTNACAIVDTTFDKVLLTIGNAELTFAEYNGYDIMNID